MSRCPEGDRDGLRIQVGIRHRPIAEQILRAEGGGFDWPPRGFIKQDMSDGRTVRAAVEMSPPSSSPSLQTPSELIGGLYLFVQKQQNVLKTSVECKVELDQIRECFYSNAELDHSPLIDIIDVTQILVSGRTQLAEIVPL